MHTSRRIDTYDPSPAVLPKTPACADGGGGGPALR